MKPWWQSKTVWINVLVGVLAVLNALSSAVTTDGTPLLPSNITQGLLIAVTAINFILRGITSQGIYYFKIMLFALLICSLGYSESVAQKQQGPPPSGDHVVKAHISGPEQVEPGDLVILDATNSSAATQYKWVLVNSKKTFLPVDGGVRLVFSSGASADYHFVLIVAGDAEGKLDVAIAEHVVTIGVPTPPTPPVPPAPPVPDGAWGFTKLAYVEGIKIPVPARDKAKAVADNFVAVADTPGILSPEDMSQRLRNRNQVTLGTDVEAWKPWFKAFSDKVEALNQANQLTTQTHFSQAMKAVAEGLNAVR